MQCGVIYDSLKINFKVNNKMTIGSNIQKQKSVTLISFVFKRESKNI